jgi:ubiquinol-cytochrome c reductase iron-sulfur subunit
MSEELNRRDAMGMALGACAAVGGVFALAGMKKAWDPLPSVKAAGTTTVDLSTAEENVLYTEKWRGKPVFIIKKNAEMIKMSGPNDTAREIDVNGAKYVMFVALCTHLGCIPAYNNEPKDFFCACHGAVYDVAGINVSGPAPLPMLIPAFRIDGTKMIIGEESPAYKKMVADGVDGSKPLDHKA